MVHMYTGNSCFGVYISNSREIFLAPGTPVFCCWMISTHSSRVQVFHKDFTFEVHKFCVYTSTKNHGNTVIAKYGLLYSLFHYIHPEKNKESGTH